jgi:hypothetical protein
VNQPLQIDTIQPTARFCCYQLDPIRDPRWAEFVGIHPKASIFHTVAWLEALQRTYRYDPVVFTTSPPTGELKNGLVFCGIKSWLTGRRLVSLPFSDHCEPLCDATEDMSFMMRYLQTTLEHQGWRYLEMRPTNADLGHRGDEITFSPSATHFLHTLDLQGNVDDLFQSLDKDSVQRRVQRAERGGLVEKCGRSEELLRDFYRLFVITRGRHRLPPSPYAWFRNLIQCLGEALEIRVAYKDEIPVASILTLRFRDAVYYKYGCSDARFNKLGAIPWLLWNATADAKSNGAIELDLGRTDEDDVGLLAFKNHWVPRPQRLVYWRYPQHSHASDPIDSWKLKAAKRAFSYMPSRLLTITGELLYRHIG